MRPATGRPLNAAWARAAENRSRLVAGLRGWSLWSAPPVMVALVLLVDAAAFAWSASALTRISPDWHLCGKFALLLITAFCYEEGSRRVARMKIRLGSPLRPDMSSVWLVASAVALTPWMTVLVALGIFAYDWFRHFKPAGEALHRKFFVACTFLLGCLLAARASHEVLAADGSLPWQLGGLLGVLAAIAALEFTNRLLVTVALVVMGVRGKVLLGSGSDNLVEFATLCLGGLVTLALLYEPWLVVLVVAPMFTLQRGALVRELEEVATTDAKTGLLNAIAWEHLADRELLRARREEYSLAVLIVDIDRFKTVNDRFGHLVGDQVLRRVGRAIAGELREYDGVGRFGGEEFVVVLPDVDWATAMSVAERIRARVARMRVSEAVEGLASVVNDELSVSVGVSCTDLGGED